MSDLEWLNSRLRNVRRVRSNGEDEREGMLVADMALNCHFRVEIVASGLEDLISKGRQYEEQNLGGTPE